MTWGEDGKRGRGRKKKLKNERRRKKSVTKKGKNLNKCKRERRVKKKLCKHEQKNHECREKKREKNGNEVVRRKRRRRKKREESGRRNEVLGTKEKKGLMYCLTIGRACNNSGNRGQVTPNSGAKRWNAHKRRATIGGKNNGIVNREGNGNRGNKHRIEKAQSWKKKKKKKKRKSERKERRKRGGIKNRRRGKERKVLQAGSLGKQCNTRKKTGEGNHFPRSHSRIPRGQKSDPSMKGSKAPHPDGSSIEKQMRREAIRINKKGGGESTPGKTYTNTSGLVQKQIRGEIGKNRERKGKREDKRGKKSTAYWKDKVDRW